MEIAREEQEEIPLVERDIDFSSTKLSHGSLLESVVAQKEEGGLRKVTRALMRTEATNVERHWSFFYTEIDLSLPERKPFPSESIPNSWRNELLQPETRYHSFVSGFAEDMIGFGDSLPDELFLWILNDACFEQDDILRTSYYNVLKESAEEQTSRLVNPTILEKLFRNLGATPNAISVDEKIIPTAGRNSPKLDHDWSRLCSFIQYLILIAHALEPNSRELVICLLLRMMADTIIYKNIDLLDTSQTTLRYLCKYIEEDVWEASVSDRPHPLCS
jgi:hypothetical protein